MAPRKLTEAEIKEILSFLRPNEFIPADTAESVYTKTYQSLYKQLVRVEIEPAAIPLLAKQLRTIYQNTIIQPGECVGIITAQSIGERQTQTNLNSFHRAGSADKQPVVSKFAELLNATSKPKAPMYWVYFTEGNDTVPNLRRTIKNTLVQLTLKRISTDVSCHLDKKAEEWYKVHDILHGPRPDYTDCVSIKIDMDILYEYQIRLSDIAEKINSEYADIYCLYSPDCFAQLDLYVDTSNIELPEEKQIFDNAREIYLEEVVQPIIENVIVCGIPGILNMYFLQDKGGKWLVETENSREKVAESNKFRHTKEKPADSTKRFKRLLAHPYVDKVNTISNNVWDIYHTFGIEAVRQYMIEQFSNIMEGINKCHVMLLVDKMTYLGTIASISRYSMRREDVGVFSRASFEETLDNFLNAGVYGQQEPVRGVSSSIICGKRAPIGTGLCELTFDSSKFNQ